MVNIKNINNTKVSHLFVGFCPSLQSLSSLSSFSSEQKSIKNLRPHFLTFFMKQALRQWGFLQIWLWGNFLISLVILSGKRGSNPRPSAWEADALPTELLPHAVYFLSSSKAGFYKSLF